MKQPTTAIFDIGKTNKKLFLFDDNFQIVWEKNDTLPETTDEDGYPCEDIALLSQWVIDSWKEVNNKPNFSIKAVNFSGYGASFVHIGHNEKPVAPLYNYLKPFSETLQKQFYDTYGGEEAFATQTASPVLGNLNSGMQLYRLKYEKPAIFAQIKYSLHLPQYLSFLISGQYVSDITSIGCHTNLWNFQTNQYHEWVEKEGIIEKLAPIALNLPPSGAGLHDSSAALIPYLAAFSTPFLLISTGTWCISLNPFNASPLTFEELQQDCLCYLTYTGQPVKASRLFAGNEHEIQTKRLAEHFGVAHSYFKTVNYDANLLTNHWTDDLSQYSSYELAYHALIQDLVRQQIVATNLVFQEGITQKLFVDGGFSKNSIYMNLLAKAYPNTEIYAASVAQASALGAALAVSDVKNNDNLIQLQRYK